MSRPPGWMASHGHTGRPATSVMLTNGQLGRRSADSTAGRNLDAARVPHLLPLAQLAHMHHGRFLLGGKGGSASLKIGWENNRSTEIK